MLGFFALPLAIVALVLVFAAEESLAFVALIVGLALWWLFASLAYYGAGSGDPWVRGAVVAMLGAALLVVEFFLWVALLVGIS